MHAISAIPTSAAGELCRPRRRALGAIARQVAVDLTPQAVEQVASRVVHLLHRQQPQTREDLGMVTVSQLAQHLKLNPAWVYEHSDELGAIRIGDGPKARIRFDLEVAKAALAQHRASRAPARATKPRKPRQAPPSPYRTDAPLLEVRDPYMRGIRARFAVAPRRGRIGAI